MKMRCLALPAVVLGTLAATSAGAQPSAGWAQVELPSVSSSYDYYVPPDINTTLPTPVIVFLHRGGDQPVDYREALQGAAAATGAIVALPLATSTFGWGYPTDPAIIDAALQHLRSIVQVNPSRVSIAGHGDGASYAIELAYDTIGAYSAFFGVAPSSSVLSAPKELEYVPPARLYYGQDDPNREAHLEALLTTLESREITVDVEVLPGQGADDLPAAAIGAGFTFLVAQSRGGAITQFGCENGEDVICLTEGRFRVTVDWKAADGNSGSGKVASLRSDGSGLFWFFNPKNWELLVKVLDGCSINEHFWVFLAASTNLEYTLTVEDLLAQTSVVYANPQGQSAPAVNDTSALETCDAAGE
jgi:acetyl esterase/lipase